MYLEMELAVNWLILVIDQFECVTAVSIHVTIAIRNTSVTKQEANLMCCFWTQTDKIPEHVGILEILIEMFQ